MAGEIPDRSEQKKAAGEPEAPATDAPDPATDDRDPRIAVARETPDPVDHATTVLRTDAGADGDEEEGGEPAGADADAGGADKADAADDAKGEAGAAGEARDAEADAEADSGAEGAGTAGEAGGSAKGEDAEDEPDGSAGRDEADGDGAEAGDGKAGAASGASGTETGTDGRLRDAVAAWVATDEAGEADEADEKGKSGEVEADSADADADEAAGEGEEEVEGASEAPEEPVRGAGGPKVPAAREAGDSEPEREPESEPKAEAEADGSDDADDADDDDDDDAPKPAKAAAGDKPAESEGEGEESSATAGGESDGAGESGVKKDTGDGGVPVQGGKPEDGAEKADEGDGEAADGEDAAVVSTGVKLRKVGKREGVDQPTAVFRAPKSGPEVDQPTTMLKVGDAKPEPKDEAKPEDEPGKAEKGAGGESEAERTSKFVPLRGLDGPAAVKPKPAEPKPAKVEAPRAEAAVPAPAAPADETAALPVAERTTQQPLPPLDLLAELTNTPPPPETPLRTAVRRVKIWTPLVILLLIVFAVVQSVRPLPEGTLALTAEETYTFKGEEPAMPWPTEGQATVTVDGIGSLGSYGEQKPIPIGSVAKVMTAYTILREHPVKKGTEGEMLTIDAKAQRDYENAGQESTVKVTEGQKISVKEAIEAIMLPSANNIARQLARWDSDGDEAAFVEKMNKYAAELGMENTTYTDPSGLKETTVSSAEDQVKLGKAVMEFETFSSVVRLPNYESTTSGQTEKNYNFLVPMYGVVGIKTGSTTKAGGNLLFAAEKVVDGEKQLIIGAVFGQHAPPILDTATARSKDLILRTQELLTSKPVVKKGDVVGHVDDGLGSTTPVVATKDVPAVGWPGLTVKLALDDGGKALPHEAKAGTKVGVLSVGDGTGDAVEVPVALQSDLAEPSFGAKLQRIG
ncbi:serine hydrolase [Streptomyces albidoflavus]|uniref:serine hydrolase n=1 Tax=Streptomyces albidoflavus TaxID=1886 RepID=UPI0033B91ADE